MPKVMSPEEREAYLAGVHVGVLTVATGGERGPLATPLWYQYKPGGSVRFLSGSESRKARLIQAASRATLCVQSDKMPYRYVTVEGPVAEIGASEAGFRREVYHRYLGPEAGDQALEALADVARDEVIFELVPQRWTSSDYSEDFAEA
jgi:nitroimidazol reductase NimA-like FMN-containing flavoprotein (pyridoxamine 5'-phosphate oxidase superfamily)